MRQVRVIVGLLVLMLVGFSPAVLAQDNLGASLTYQAHVSDIGWQDPVPAGQTAGITGQSKRVECLRVNTGQDPAVLGVTVTPYVQNIGWSTPGSNGADAGTVGQNAPLEAVRMSLTGSEAGNYSIFYRVHSANFGWLGWAADDAEAGTMDCAFPIEAIEIQILPKGSAAPGDTANPKITNKDIHLSLRTHVENIGWTDPVPGSVSGTTGQGLKVEAVEAIVSDPKGTSSITGQAFVQNQGWQQEGQPNNAIGTTGQNLQIEGLRFTLHGAAAKLYDVNYRVHVANLGWMPWQANGQAVGTANGNLRVEAVDLVLQPKGQAAVQAGAYKEIQIPTGIIPPAKQCITLSIGRQRMAYYENYDLVVDTNVVTGMRGIDDTKVGDFTVLEKLSPYRTAGPGYDSMVNYWLTLYRGDIYGFSGEGHIVDRVGIHDAGWRSAWGSTAYLSNGSHGCVNTPFNAMQTIFTRIPQGAPVKIR